MGDFDVPPPERLALRCPTIGDSLPRPASPHLLPPEELRLGGPPATVTPPGRRPRVDVADLMSAVGHYTEEPPLVGPVRTSRAMPVAPPAPVREPAVRLEGEASGRATSRGPTGAGEVRASVGSEHTRVAAHGGIEAGRDAEGATLEGSAGGSLHHEGHGGSVELEGGVHGLGTRHLTGSAAARARLGRESRPHLEVGVSGEHLGGEHPEVSTRVGASTGDTGIAGELEAGGALGEAPRVGGSVTVRPDRATSLRVGGSGVVGGRGPDARASAELRRRIAAGVDLTAGVSAEGIGGSAPAVSGTLNVGGRF